MKAVNKRWLFGERRSNEEDKMLGCKIYVSGSGTKQAENIPGKPIVKMCKNNEGSEWDSTIYTETFELSE